MLRSFIFFSQKTFFVTVISIFFVYSSAVLSSNDYEELDQFESVNRAMFAFNDNADRYVLKPIAKAYRFVTPDFVDEAITNVFNNLGDIETFANSILQAKFHNATVSLNRVIYNTVFGLGGLIDVATPFGLQNSQEDFGQTLGYWGYEQSSYLVLPFFGPSSVRDFGGRIVDYGLDPMHYQDEIESSHSLMLTGVKLIDLRADLLGAENLLLGEDRYRFMRSAYFQNREYLIKDGEVEDSFSDDDFDYDDF